MVIFADPVLIKTSCEPHNQNGYINGVLKCNRQKNAGSVFRVLVRDIFSSRDYATDDEDNYMGGEPSTMYSSRPNIKPMYCYSDYLKLVRHTVEKRFNEQINVLERICEPRRSQRHKTGAHTTI